MRRPANVQKGRNGRSGTDQGIEGLSLSLCDLASRDALNMANWPLHDGRAAVPSGPSALGDGVPAQGCGLSQPDRALAEDPALTGDRGRRFETWDEISEAIHRSTV
jgi:hypothetical protein